MWKGPITDELRELYAQYKERFHGAQADGYDDLYYDDMTCEEFAFYMRKCLETGREMPHIVP